MPALQIIYGGVSTIRFNLAALDALHQDIGEKAPDFKLQRSEQVRPLRLEQVLELNNITYTYNGAEKPALRDINLRISANTTVGFAGKTGSGKTTVIDIILGLLDPQEGHLLVDFEKLQGDLIPRWQRNIGYVPQFIYLADDTVAGNIAFGVPVNEIDRKAVERAAIIANLHEFVRLELPQGYDTYIGERGIRLSGGQRQRIGIARALYHEPQVLVLDEATSALDNITEEAVMQAIRSLSGKKTILMIAHRLTTLQGCDIIHFLKNGRIDAFGSFEDLSQSNDEFRKMAKENHSRAF